MKGRSACSGKIFTNLPHLGMQQNVALRLVTHPWIGDVLFANLHLCRHKERVTSEMSLKLTICYLNVLVQALGDNLIDSVVSENIPLLTADEKFNETVVSIAKRVGAVLNSKPLATLALHAKGLLNHLRAL